MKLRNINLSNFSNSSKKIYYKRLTTYVFLLAFSICLVSSLQSEDLSSISAFIKINWNWGGGYW